MPGSPGTEGSGLKGAEGYTVPAEALRRRGSARCQDVAGEGE